MKVAIALLALVAVSQAAFTGTLQQRTQPLVNQAMFKMQLVGGRSGIMDMIVQMLQPHIDGIMAEVASTAAGMHTAAANHAQNLNEWIQSMGLNPDSVIGLMPQNVQNVWNNLINHQGKIDMSAIAGAVQTQIQTQMDNVNAMIAAMAAQANALAQQLTMDNLLAWLQTQMQSRGWFSNLWNSMTDAAGNAWDTVSGHASNAWDHWTGIISTAAGTTMDTVSAMANEFIADAQENAGQITAQAAQNFQTMMSQWQTELGDQWEVIQANVQNIVANGNKPVGRRF